MASCLYNFSVSQTMRYFLGIFNIAQGLTAILGNILVFMLVINNKKLQMRSNVFLLSLAVSDFLVGALLEPMFVAQFFSQELRENCSFNKIRRYLSTFLMGGAVNSIALISYDRWVHLTKTVRYNDFMPKIKVAILVTIAWLIPTVVPFIRFASEAVYSTVIIIYILAVLALMTTCYVVIVKMVRSRENALRRTDVKSRAKETANHIRVAKAIVLIIVCLLATFLPISVYHGVTALNGISKGLVLISDDTKEICYAVLLTLGLANSGINPAIYYFRIPEFRASMKRLFGRVWTPKTDLRSESTNESTERSM